MAQTWPESLPACPLPDWERTGPTGNIMRTQMEVGPAKVRRRGSAGPIRYAVRFRLSYAEMLTFRSWYATDIGSGSEPFEFEDPVTRQLALFRFAEEGYSVQRPAPASWMVSMVWELLPS